MTAKEKFVKMINFIEDLFMTNHKCICCSKEIIDGTKFQVCDACKDNFVLLENNLCEKCGELIINENSLCDYCKNFGYNFDVNHSYAYYGDATARIVKGLKYHHKKYFARHVAEMICNIKDYFADVDIISFVPITDKRRKARGYNQAEEIAKSIGIILGKPVLSLLVKIKEDTKHQAELSRADRLKNLIGSFETTLNAKDNVKGKVILIVDDVFTTGATLSECAKAIKRLSPKLVKTVTFAKTKLNNMSKL